MADLDLKKILELGGTGAGSLLGPVGGLVGGGIGSLIGGLTSDVPDYQSIYGGVHVPTVEELTKAGSINGTAYNQIQEDPATRQAQMAALNQIIGMGSQGGMDMQSRVAQQQALDSSNQAATSARKSALDNMAMRGQRSGGAALAAQLSGQQQEAMSNARAGAQFAGDARTRALQALSSGGQMAGQVRGQDWSNASDRAAARDRISQFNAQNARSAYDQNTAWQMQRAAGMAGAAQDQYKRETGMGQAVGTGLGGLAGYGADYLNRKKQGGA